MQKILSKARSFFEKNAVNKAINTALVRLHFRKKITGSIQVWVGPSLFDGKPIQVVISGYSKDSENEKTGPMIQISILPVDESPWESYKLGKKTVCGECKYNGQRGCYVRWSNLSNISKSSHRNTGDLSLGQALCAGLRVRVGAAGDPAAVPTYVWEALLKDSDGFTGYTHSWKSCDPALKRYFMASTDSIEETEAALNDGWSPFYVVESWEEAPEDSIKCLSYRTKGNGLPMQCIDCMKCNGQSKPKVIVEVLHGASNTISQAKETRK